MSVWFAGISLENVRCFGKKQAIRFVGKDGKPCQWNLILGDNGTGKSTVLMGLCTTLDALDSIFLTDDYFPRDDSFFGEIVVSVDTTGLENRATRWLFSAEFAFDHSGVVTQYLPDFQEAMQATPLFAYGAKRRMSTEGISGSQKLKISSLWNDAPILNAEEWLAQAELISLKDSSQKNLFERVKTMLLRLFEGEIRDIKIEVNGGPKKINVLFQTHYGWVPLQELSLGYKTLVAWMVDMAAGLLDFYPTSPDPLAEPAICLVDEIDLHLHPRFQREMIGFLTRLFPKTQFIVTAHSPLIVQAAADVDANIILLKREGNEVVVHQDATMVKNWRVDEVLTSDLFGLDTPLSPKSDEKMERRRSLLRKNSLTGVEKSELESLDQEFQLAPSVGSVDSLEARMRAHLRKLENQAA